jgi:hypothetical protein
MHTWPGPPSGYGMPRAMRCRNRTRKSASRAAQGRVSAQLARNQTQRAEADLHFEQLHAPHPGQPSRPSTVALVGGARILSWLQAANPAS